MEFKTPPHENYKLHDSNSSVSESQHHPKPADTVAHSKKSMPKVPHVVRRWWKWAVAVLVVAAVVWLAYGYIHTKNELTKLSNPKTAGQTETQQLIDKVSKLVDLPTNETPTLATVKDSSKLKTQTFFSDAQNGDKVLIYTKAGKAVLYRPSTNRIIQYSKVNLNGS